MLAKLKRNNHDEQLIIINVQSLNNMFFFLKIKKSIVQITKIINKQ